MKKNEQTVVPKKDELIATAQTVFAELGFKKVAMDDISTRMGITRTALYYYYRNKEDLFAAVLEHEIELYGKELHRVVTEDATTDERIQNFSRQYCILRKKFANIYKLTLPDYTQNVKALTILRTRMLSMHEDAIASILQSDSAVSKKGEIRRASTILTHSIRGIAITPEVPDMDEIEKSIICLLRIFVAGFSQLNRK